MGFIKDALDDFLVHHIVILLLSVSVLWIRELSKKHRFWLLLALLGVIWSLSR